MRDKTVNESLQPQTNRIWLNPAYTNTRTETGSS